MAVEPGGLLLLSSTRGDYGGHREKDRTPADSAVNIMSSQSPDYDHGGGHRGLELEEDVAAADPVEAICAPSTIG